MPTDWCNGCWDSQSSTTKSDQIPHTFFPPGRSWLFNQQPVSLGKYLRIYILTMYLYIYLYSEISMTWGKFILEIQLKPKSERSFIVIISFKETQIKHPKSVCHWYRWICLFLALINENLVFGEGVKHSKAFRSFPKAKKPATGCVCESTNEWQW